MKNQPARWWTVAILAAGTVAALAVVITTPRTWQASARIAPDAQSTQASLIALFAGPEVASHVLETHPEAVLGAAVTSDADRRRFAAVLAQRVRTTADGDGIWLVVRDTDDARALALLDAMLDAAEYVGVDLARSRALEETRVRASELDDARARFDGLAAAGVASARPAEHALWSARLRAAADAVADAEIALEEAQQVSERTTPPWTVEHRTREVLRPLPRRIGPAAAAAFLAPLSLALMYWAILRR
jgi:hypothetical protein